MRHRTHMFTQLHETHTSKQKQKHKHKRRQANAIRKQPISDYKTLDKIINIQSASE